MSLAYQPRYRVTGSPTWINFGPQITTAPFTVTVTGLAGATGYDFDVLAINSFGSTASATVTATTQSSVSESTEGTTITPANETTQFIYDANLLQWSLTSGGQVATSPSPYTTKTTDTTTSGVTEIEYHNHTVFQENTSNNWYYWTGTAWVATANLIGPTLIGGSATPSFSVGNSGIVVGAITTTTQGTAFAGAYTITGTDAAFFTMSGSNLVTAQTTTARTYSITITATQSNVIGSPLATSFGITGNASLGNLVLAHYMEAISPNGNTVAGYTQDIQDAQAIGVDGFVIDLFGWLTNTFANFQQLAGFMFTAAANLGTGFKLCFLVDWQGRSGENSTSAGNALTTLAAHPNYLTINGRPVVSGWEAGVSNTVGGSDAVFWEAVIASINGTGLNPLFIPSLTNTSLVAGGNQAQTTTNVANWYTGGWLNGNVQGLLTWGTLDPANLILENTAYGALTASHGLIIGTTVQAWFAPIRDLSLNVNPDPNMNVVEFNGGEGIAAIWMSIINTIKPQIAYLVTWNDMTETYMCPTSVATIQANDISSWQVSSDYYIPGTSHIGHTQLNKYFIQWFKTGVQPASWPDSMYVFYRNASQNMVPTGSNIGVINSWSNSGNPTLDDIYVTTILTAPATLTITTGGTPHVFSVGAGLVHTRQPFAVGAQTFVLTRGATTVISITGDPVVSTEAKYDNVNPLTYYGHNP